MTASAAAPGSPNEYDPRLAKADGCSPLSENALCDEEHANTTPSLFSSAQGSQ